MKTHILVLPKWFPLTKETLRRLVEHREILSERSMFQLHNPNIYNIITVQSMRLVLESILSRSGEIDYKNNYHYCQLLNRIDKISKALPKETSYTPRVFGLPTQNDFQLTEVLYRDSEGYIRII